MSYEGIRLYPFDQFPNVGIATIDQITEPEYRQYANVVELCEEDKAIMQAIYIWIQAYYRTILNIGHYSKQRDIPFAITTYPSYSELFCLTKLYRQLIDIVEKASRNTWPEDMQEFPKHCKLYTDAMNALGQSYWLIQHDFKPPSNKKNQCFTGLSYKTVSDFWLYSKVEDIASLLSLNATFTKDVHDYSTRDEVHRLMLK